MKAMILAAGRGERMRPLTDTCPKPLLPVAEVPLIEHHIIKLAKQGIKDIVINYAWLGKQIVEYLGNGSRFGLNIHYSPENDGALETAGGIIQALPLLDVDNDEPFLLVNGDVYTDFNFQQIPQLKEDKLVHIWLVENPEHNPTGDFAFEDYVLKNKSKVHSQSTYTFSGISLFRPSFFKTVNQEKISKLGPMIKSAVERNQVNATLLKEYWVDVGTPGRLANLNDRLSKQ